MNKIALDTEQMKILEASGLDTSDASLAWHDTGKGWELKPNTRKEEHVPAYTLEDILHKLPAETEDDGFVYMPYLELDDGGRFGMGYRMAMGENLVSVQWTENAIDAAFILLSWLVDNRYVRKDRE